MAAPMPHVGKVLYRYAIHSSRCRPMRNRFVKPYYVYTSFNICKFSSNSNENWNDFYGISMSEETSVNGVRSLSKLELHKKYAFKDVGVKDRGTVKSFGSIRVEETNKKSRNRRSTRKRSSYKYTSDEIVEIDSHNTHAHQNQLVSSQRNNISTVSLFDEQYFGSDFESKYQHSRSIRDERIHQDNNNIPQNNRERSTSIRNDQSTTDSMNYVDSQYFYTINEVDVSPSINQAINDSSHRDQKVYGQGNNMERTNTMDNSFHAKNENLNFVDKQYFDTVHDSQEPIENCKQQISQKTRFRSDNVSQDKDLNNSPRKKATQKYEKSNTDKNPKSAFDVAMEVRKSLKSPHSEETMSKSKPQLFAGPVDSKGYRILRNQVPDIMNTPSAMVAKLLKDSIIYNRGDILAIEKPYGLPSHGGPGVHMSVAHLLPELTRLVDPSGQLDTLHMVHRLDRQTTGVMLLAKTSETAWQLHRAFRKREVVKRYWVLTKGLPIPEEGVIDIPMAEGTVDRYHRMVLKPERTDETREIIQKSSMKTFEAVTQYRVLASHGPAALVECTPSTGVKHQIRVHLAFGLNTPILGDHKYSHITKVAPQRLHPDLLDRLGIRQSKVRHLPMMLHAKSLLLPEFHDGRNIFISCRLPLHFRINMNRLKIKPPKTD